EHIDLALVAGGADGTLRFYDITRAAAIRLVGVVRVAGEALDVAVNSTDRLAYVAAGAGGVAFVDVQGPTSVQPIDVDFSGDDDRILGATATTASATDVVVDAARGLAAAGVGQRLSILQVAPTHARILTLLRDPVQAVTGDEQPLAGGDTAYTTDDAIRIAVDSGIDASGVFLTVEETPSGANPILTLPGGVPSVPLESGQATVELRNTNGDISSPSVATVRLVNAAGAVLDATTISLSIADVTHSIPRTLYLAASQLVLQAGGESDQIHLGAYFDDGRA